MLSNLSSINKVRFTGDFKDLSSNTRPILHSILRQAQDRMKDWADMIIDEENTKYVIQLLRIELGVSFLQSLLMEDASPDFCF